MLRLTALVWSLNERYFNGHQLRAQTDTPLLGCCISTDHCLP